jgi:hypothetical protein
MEEEICNISDLTATKDLTANSVIGAERIKLNLVGVIDLGLKRVI